MSFEVIGKLLVKYDTQNVSDRFKKREFVLELSEDINGNTYTNYAKMQLVQNKCELLDRYNEGDTVKVNFNIKGNRWERDGKVNFITNLDAWRIEAAQGNGQGHSMGAAQAMPAYSGTNNSPAPFYNPSPENSDDLPF